MFDADLLKQALVTPVADTLLAASHNTNPDTAFRHGAGLADSVLGRAALFGLGGGALGAWLGPKNKKMESTRVGLTRGALTGAGSGIGGILGLGGGALLGRGLGQAAAGQAGVNPGLLLGSTLGTLAGTGLGGLGGYGLSGLLTGKDKDETLKKKAAVSLLNMVGKESK